MSEQDKEDRLPLRGHLVIHVGGYKQVQRNAYYTFSSAPGVLVPDGLVPAPVHDPETPEWIEDGWAVGDNPRGRFCKWNGNKPLRRFKDFDEAVGFVFRLRQKRKRANEVYTLVYVTRGSLGKDVSGTVASLDEIDTMEAQIAAERSQIEAAQAEYRKQLEIERPAYHQLREAYGYVRARALSEFLRRVRQEGPASVKADGPNSTFYRNMRDLRALGLLD